MSMCDCFGEFSAIIFLSPFFSFCLAQHAHRAFSRVEPITVEQRGSKFGRETWVIVAMTCSGKRSPHRWHRMAPHMAAIVSVSPPGDTASRSATNGSSANRQASAKAAGDRFVGFNKCHTRCAGSVQTLYPVAWQAALSATSVRATTSAFALRHGRNRR